MQQPNGAAGARSLDAVQKELEAQLAVILDPDTSDNAKHVRSGFQSLSLLAILFVSTPPPPHFPMCAS